MKLNDRLVVIAAAALVLTAERAAAAAEVPVPSVAGVLVVSDAGEMRGTAVLIHREENAGWITLYFLTSARLFRGPDGNYERVSKAVTLRLDEARSLNVKCNDVIADGSGLVDVAIVRARTRDAGGLHPTPLAYNPPPAGAAFLLAGIGEAGKPSTVPEHVRFESTLLVVGDHGATPPLADCVGAAAVTADGVFGIVRECEPHRSPVVSVLTMARSFLERRIAPRTSRGVTSPPFIGQRKEGAS